MSVPGVASRAADRFYCPPPRRHHLFQQQQPPPPPVADEKTAKPTVELQRDPPAAAGETNLESFMASTAVRVPAQRLPRTSAAYYELTDLWEAFREWSAYGAGVPLVLNGTSPSCRLSSSMSPGRRRRLKVLDDLVKTAMVTVLRIQAVTESDNQESHPVFRYLEHDAPYGRQPLLDMISILTSRFPDLKRYRSCDLLPSSWISVAWYPIYRIPTGPTLQDLDACFLTFHALSTRPEGTLTGHPETNDLHNMEIADVRGKITLPLIGLASYKFSGSMWTSNQQYEQQLTASLLKDADEWLCQRQVHHPDYRFFLLH